MNYMDHHHYYLNAALIECYTQFSSKMLRIFLVACLTSVVITLDHSDQECPFDMKEQFSLNGFQDEILKCVFILLRCSSGSLTLSKPVCLFRKEYILKTPDVKPNDGLFNGEIQVLFSRNEVPNPEGEKLNSLFHYTAKIHMNMENLTAVEYIPSRVTPEESTRYLKTVMDLLPKMINKDPGFQMKFHRPGKIDLKTVDEIRLEGDADYAGKYA